MNCLSFPQANEDRTFKDIMDKSNAEKAKYEDEIRSLKVSLCALYFGLLLCDDQIGNALFLKIIETSTGAES